MDTSPVAPSPAPRPVRTVLGDISYELLGLTDAHNHAWIDEVAGGDPAAPVLNQYDEILLELCAYQAAGGVSLLDCQPGGCGRDGNRLVQLTREAGVNIIASTGFHRKRYYPPDFWMFSAAETRVANYFTSEINDELEECKRQEFSVRAGFIKIALEADWKDTPQAALQAAAAAARETRAMVEIHTEKGRLAERAVIFFEGHGVPPTQLVLCHMDKRPDAGLHAELAKLGVLLEYDTFFRPKYAPETNLWPLILQMVSSGFSRQVALATDMADTSQYQTFSGGPGLAGLPGQIRNRLQEHHIPLNSIREMLGGNIARRLAGLI